MPASRLALVRRLFAFGVVALVVFALYAPSLRLMLLHDDAVNIYWMDGYTPLTIFFADWSAGGASARPMSNVLWLLVRDLFGWFWPPLIHAWNVWLHTLNVVLVAMLAARLGSRLNLPSLLFPTLAALLFGLFPLSYQSVIWAGAIYHPVMAAFGLAAVHASLTAQRRRSARWWALTGGLVLGASLSHEAGFLFGPLILLIHVVLMRKASIGALAITLITLIYPAVNRLVVASSRPSSESAIRPLNEIASNAMYFMQSFVSWLVIWLRPVVGLGDGARAVIVVLFVISMILALWLLARLRLFRPGIIGLGWWALTSAVPIVVLDNYYVSFGPRLLYVPSVGTALFWGAIVAGIVQAGRLPALKIAVIGFVALMLAWCVPYIAERMTETARLTPAMRAMDTDLRTSPPDARVLIVNGPWWNAPSDPAFFIGAEGMPLFQHGGAPARTWLATVSGTQRETTFIRHEPSLTFGERWFYGQPGDAADDVTLRAKMLDANLIYRFDFDAPGLRGQRIARIQPVTNAMEQSYLASLTDGVGRALIHGAEAWLCGDQLWLDVTWSMEKPFTHPLGVFVHGLDTQGQRALTADRDLLDGVLPLDQLPTGKWVEERRVVPLASPAPALMEIRLGAYLRENVQRLTATRPDGATWPGDEVVVPVQPSCAR